MKNLLLFIVGGFILLSCSDSKKTDSDYRLTNDNDCKVDFQIFANTEIEMGRPKTTGYTLLGISINDKKVEIKSTDLKLDPNFPNLKTRFILDPNVKYRLETANIGDIYVQINEDKNSNSFTTDLWLTNKQIRELK
jgi:hypothetical protein